MVNRTWGYAGTPDLWLPYNQPVVVDFKTGADMPHYTVQMAGYAQIREPHASSAHIVLLSADGNYKVREVGALELARTWNVFRAALIVNAWKGDNGVKFN